MWDNSVAGLLRSTTFRTALEKRQALLQQEKVFLRIIYSQIAKNHPDQLPIAKTENRLIKRINNSNLMGIWK